MILSVPPLLTQMNQILSHIARPTGCTTMSNEMFSDTPSETHVPLEEFSVTEITTIPLTSVEAENLKLCELLACHKLPFKPRELPQTSHQSLLAPVKVAGFTPCHKGWLIPSLSATSMLPQVCTTWPMCQQRTSTRPLRTYSTINTWIFKST